MHLHNNPVKYDQLKTHWTSFWKTVKIKIPNLRTARKLERKYIHQMGKPKVQTHQTNGKQLSFFLTWNRHLYRNQM